MNKLILVLLLAVCLVTAHAAIVKRDAPETTKPQFDISKELERFKKNLEETLNPDKLKETFSKLGDQFQHEIKKIMPTEAPKA